MRDIDAELQTALETGDGIGIAKAYIRPFALPESITDIGTIDAADAADSGFDYIIRVRKVTTAVQINRFTKTGYNTAANWNSWTTLQTEATNITNIGIFFYTGTNPRVYVFWMKTGNTSVFYRYSADEGATWAATATLISGGANTIDLLQGIHEGGFFHRNVTTNELFLYAYKPSDGTFVINTIPVPDTANVILSARGSKRTIKLNGIDTDVITIALISEVDAVTADNRLWIGSATGYLTAGDVWTSATVLRTQGAFSITQVHSVFDDYITFTQGTTAIACKLLDYYGITWGYLYPRALVTTPTIIGYDDEGTAVVYNNGYYAAITGTDIEYIVLEYHATRESIQCRMTGTTIPVDGILLVSRGYNVDQVDYYEQLTPYRILSWRTNPDRTFTIQAVTGMMALQGRELPPGLQVNVTRAQTYRLCFAAIGISCTPNSEAILNAQPYALTEPSTTSLTAAINRISNAGSIEIWNTEYGLRAIATQSTTSTQTITPDGGLLPHKDYSQAMGLHASWPLDIAGVIYNQINSAIEGDGGYPYWPSVVGFPYNPSDFDEDLIENLHEERQHLGFFGTRANMSLEVGDVITIVASKLRIIDIIEIFPVMMQEIRYRWQTEPLALGDYGITPTQSSGGQIAIAPIQGHTHNDSGGGVTAPLTTALDDFQMGNGSGLWIKKTLTEAVTRIRTILDAIYSAAAHTHAHSAATGIGANDHHAQDHAHNATDAQKLTQANSHQSPDTDSAAGSLHHTVGTGATQAAAGNHAHEVDQRADMWSDGEGNPADVASASADGTSTYGARRDHVHKGALNAVLIYPTNALGNTIPASTTHYACPFVAGATTTTERAMVLLRAGTIKNLYIRLTTAQPASGSLVVHVRSGSSTDIITLTIPAGSPGPATYSNTVTTSAGSPGDFLGFKLVNNATAASAAIGFMAFEIELNP